MLLYFESMLLYIESIICTLKVHFCTLNVYFCTFKVHFWTLNVYLLYFANILLYFATMLEQRKGGNWFIYFTNANLLAVGDTTYAYSFFLIVTWRNDPIWFTFLQRVETQSQLAWLFLFTRDYWEPPRFFEGFQVFIGAVTDTLRTSYRGSWPKPWLMCCNSGALTWYILDDRLIPLHSSFEFSGSLYITH